MIPNDNNISTKVDFSINGLLDALRRFNAKERFHLVGYFLGKPEFRPDRKRLSDLEHELKIPKGIFVEATDIFCGMDYHLDWLNGALELAFLPSAGGLRVGKRVTGTQEDIDLLLAFDTPTHLKRYHIVLIEAKGVISFSNKQLESKLNRLNDIFFEGGQPRFQNLGVHLVLAAPRPPVEGRLNWPSDTFWKPIFMHLPMGGNFLKITRTDDLGNPTKKGWKNWKIEER